MIHFTFATLMNFNSFQKVGVGKEWMKIFASSLPPRSSFFQDDNKLQSPCMRSLSSKTLKLLITKLIGLLREHGILVQKNVLCKYLV